MTNRSLESLLQSCGQKRSRPDQSFYTALLYADECAIAEQTGKPLLEIECAALALEIVPERYSRNQKTLSCQDQIRLLTSHVAVIGLGGLGGTVTELLARLGVGQLTLVDGDSFDESNLNRQLLSSPAKLGEKKAGVAKARVQEINSAVTVNEVTEFFTVANGASILHGTQLAVDCLDTIADRFILEKMCQHSDIPLVSAAIGGTSGQAIAIFPGDPGLKTIYGSPDKAPARGIESSRGTLPFAALYMAAVECAEIATILLGKPSELRHRLMLAEVSDHTAELINLPKQDSSPNQKQ